MDAQVKSPLYAKLNRVMLEVDRIGKDAENSFHKYHYTSADAVATVIREAIANAGLAFSASAVSRELVSLSTSKGKQAIRWVVEYRFGFHDPDSGDSLVLPWFGEADADDDKGINKANTAAEKYFLLKTFIVSTGDEPDADADGPRKPGKPARQNPPQNADADDGDDDDEPAPAWYAVTANTDKLYERLIANGYGKDRDDVRALMGKAGIDLHFLQGYTTLAEAAPAIRAKLDAHLSSGKPAQPANAPSTPESASEADVMLADAEAANDDPLANVKPRDPDASWEDKAVAQAESWTGMNSADILAKLGKPSWTSYGNLTTATEALAEAIGKHALQFRCQMLSYTALGSGVQIIFRAPGGKQNVPMPGGREELARHMGGNTSAQYTRFAVENKLADWKKSSELIKLNTPVLVSWRWNGKKAEVTALTPVFQDAEQQAA